MRDYFSRLFTYTDWANRRVLTLLEESPGEPAEPLRLFAHVLNAERIWLLRVRGGETGRMEIWPTLSIAECRTLAAENLSGYSAYLESSSEDELERYVRYRNQTGARFETRVSDILTHVAFHGGYHRGQIALALRRSGAEPVNTDFITFVREGK